MPYMKAAKVVTCRTATKLQTSREAGSSWTAMPAPAANSHHDQQLQRLQQIRWCTEIAMVEHVIWTLPVQALPLQSCIMRAGWLCKRARMWQRWSFTWRVQSLEQHEVHASRQEITGMYPFNKRPSNAVFSSMFSCFFS